MTRILSRYNTESTVKWISNMIMKSKNSMKHGFSDLVLGLSVKDINTKNREINILAKLCLRTCYIVIVINLLFSTFVEAYKNRKMPDEVKSKLLASNNLKYKKLFYRGDGFASQLVEFADYIYQPLDSDIKTILGYSYSDVRNLFIRFYQESYNENTNYISLVVLEKTYGKVTLKRILEDFSISKFANEDFVEITSRNEISEKPLIVVNGKVYAPILSQLIYNIPKFFHYELLNLNRRFPNIPEAKSLKNKYVQVRGNKLEVIVHDEIMNLLKGENERSYHDLKYDNGEADITAQIGNTSILFEVKGRLITLSTFSGDIESFENDFKLAIQDAYKQAVRTQKHIKSNGKFHYGKSKKKFTLKKTTDYIKVCVTAENFGATAIELDKLVTELKDGGTLPLSLNIYDLLFVIKNCESMSELIDYFNYRLEYYGFIMSVDELEIYGAFKKKKAFRKVENQITMIKDQIHEMEAVMNLISHDKIMNYRIDIL